MKRAECNDDYSSADYEVCLLREGESATWHFITEIVNSGEMPERVALRALEDQTGFTGLLLLDDLRVCIDIDLSVLCHTVSYVRARNA